VLALLTDQDNKELCPFVIVLGTAVKDEIVGEFCGTGIEAEQVVVATVDDASSAYKFIEYTPGLPVIICDGLVLPFPHTKVTGAIPPEDDAVHVTLVAEGAPVHVVVS